MSPVIENEPTAVDKVCTSIFVQSVCTATVLDGMETKVSSHAAEYCALSDAQAQATNSSTLYTGSIWHLNSVLYASAMYEYPAR